MNRTECVDLMMEIKKVYPTFKVEPEIVNAWFQRLSDLDYHAALGSLDDYIKNEETTRPPTIAHIRKKTVRVTSVDEDADYRKKMQLRYYDRATHIDQNGMLWGIPGEEE